MKESRETFKKHIANVLTLIGASDVESKANKIYDLEMALAKVHWSRTDSADLKKVNNRWPRKKLDTAAPSGIDWAAYLQAAGMTDVKEFIVWQPSAVVSQAALVGSEPIETWKDFLTFHYVENYSPFLSSSFVNEWFDFNGKALTGAPELAPRWKRER